MTITLSDTTKGIDSKNKEPMHTVVGQNLKGESKLVVLKEIEEIPGLSVEQTWVRKIQGREELLWRDSHPGKKLFITVCNLCKARHLLDFDAEKKHFECTCEIGAPNKEQSHYYICSAFHAHFDIKKSFNGTKNDCKICQHVLSAKTKKEAEFDKQVRAEDAEERRVNEKLRKEIEDGKARAKAEEKKTEAELFASVLAKQLMPLFEGLRNEIRDAKEK